jgi:hypothetical protein
MRVGTVSVGVGLIVVGVVWILQGVGLLEGSFMTGQAFWVWMGALALLIGVLTLLRGLRRS